MFNCRFYNKAEACDSTDSTARRDNEVSLFFWIGITPHAAARRTCSKEPASLSASVLVCLLPV